MKHTNRTCLSYWFPKIRDAGLPVPKTTILRIPSDECRNDLFGPLDGNPIGKAGMEFICQVVDAARAIGLPCFLRTGETSNKHHWEDTCYIEDGEDIAGHMMQLIEFSEIADFIGLPWDVWVVRELLSTKPLGEIYSGMPLCREFRVFVDGERVLCWHPYWPRQAVIDGFPINPDIPCEWDDEEFPRLLPSDFDTLYEKLTTCSNKDLETIKSLASQAGNACGGRWSVDILDTERGWYVTDMAEMDRSWHWPGCQVVAR